MFYNEEINGWGSVCLVIKKMMFKQKRNGMRLMQSVGLSYTKSFFNW